MISLFAQLPMQTWSLGQIAIAVVIVAALIALTYIALRQFGIQIPEWFAHVVWVLVVAFVVILAIKILMTMW